MGPALPHLLSLTWRHGLFAHWPVDPERLRPRIPASLELDTRDGAAWIGVLPFVASEARIRGLPRSVGVAVPELNVRTYVRVDGSPGVYFFAVHVGSRLAAAAARAATPLPVRRAEMRVTPRDDGVGFSSRRPTGTRPAVFEGRYGPVGAADHASPGSLEHWLVERRRVYAPVDRGVAVGEVGHGPWSIQPAALDVRTNTVFESLDLPTPDREPTVHYAAKQPMTASAFRRIDARRRRPARQTPS